MIRSLNHYTIAAIDIDANINFYSNVLGLIHGESLPGSESGAYFYIQDNN